MSFFRKPGDDSSDSNPSDAEDDGIQHSYTEELSYSSVKEPNDIVPPTDQDAEPETLAREITKTMSEDENGTVFDREQMRDLAISSMLEEFAKYKAADMMNKAGAGIGRSFYDKDSPEVQEFAKALFIQSSGILEQGGLIPAQSASDSNSMRRQNFLTGLASLSRRTAVSKQKPGLADRGRQDTRRPGSAALVRRESQPPPVPFQGTINGQLQQLTWEMSNMNIAGRPSSELHIGHIPPVLNMPSRYVTNFQERGMLGRGGFGRVYQAFNVLDKQTYAVKKIPLSPSLSRRYQQRGHNELGHILREAQALARLEHPNVVRYYATWVEEPAVSHREASRARPLPMVSQRGQLLLDNKPAAKMSPSQVGHVSSTSIGVNFNDPFELSGNTDPRLPLRRIVSATSEECNDDSHDPFARSVNAGNDDQGLLWSAGPSQPVLQSRLSDKDTMNIFTDDNVRRSSSIVSHIEHGSHYVLYVQMSMYPLTLSEYIKPASSPRRNSQTSSRHCFHIVPALRLLLSILCGLQYIHSQGLLHRDIKPSNIFLSPIDVVSQIALPEPGYADIGSCPVCSPSTPRFVNPRIGDFGLVADLAKDQEPVQHRFSDQARSSSSNKPVGTEFYRAPPHRHGHDWVDERVDVFALGVILLELLWSCTTRMERIELLKGAQEGRIPPGFNEKVAAEGLSYEAGKRLQTCIHGMIDPDPHQRWRCATVKIELEGLLIMMESEDSQKE